MKLLWSRPECMKLLRISAWTWHYHIKPLFSPACVPKTPGRKGTNKTFYTTDQVIAMMRHYYRMDERAHAEIVRRMEAWEKPTSLTIIEDDSKSQSHKKPK